jgi:uncharacterized radical SAM superfamily Fe-S cluster-containing enzyme
MHAVDYCNLNCKACIHYSPLFSKEEHINALIYKDIALLSKITRSIMSFYILGGEPLLRDDLCEVVECARSTFPDSDIQILTNGILVSEKLSDLWKTMQKCNVSLTVSEYEPTHGRTMNIKSILEAYGVPYVMRPYKDKKSFVKTLSLFTDTKYPRTCISNGCVNVYNEKVAKCPAVMYISRLNETFSIGLPKYGIYELKDFGNAEELYKKMKERIPLCDHCYNYEIEWQQCKKERNLSDFVIVDE